MPWLAPTSTLHYTSDWCRANPWCVRQWLSLRVINAVTVAFQRVSSRPASLPHAAFHSSRDTDKRCCSRCQFFSPIEAVHARTFSMSTLSFRNSTPGILLHRVRSGALWGGVIHALTSFCYAEALCGLLEVVRRVLGLEFRQYPSVHPPLRLLCLLAAVAAAPTPTSTLDRIEPTAMPQGSLTSVRWGKYED